jgi:hypothetical protein
MFMLAEKDLAQPFGGGVSCKATACCTVTTNESLPSVAVSKTHTVDVVPSLCMRNSIVIDYPDASTATQPREPGTRVAFCQMQR